MKNKLFFYLSFLLLISCKEHQKENIVEQTDSTLQLYNDVLIDYVENYGYWRYLGDEGINAPFEITDSVQRIKRKIYLHNKLFNHKNLQETVFLIDSTTDNNFRDNYNFEGDNPLNSVYKSIDANPKIVVDSIKQSSIKFKANQFKSSTFRIKLCLCRYR